ncbi:MAG: hypothetical protein M1825_001831 [Sarcosagium campestre]|nr:MAG: hypothetical protein M1825_001831 [Sarcosagium campestre]
MNGDTYSSRDRDRYSSSRGQHSSRSDREDPRDRDRHRERERGGHERERRRSRSPPYRSSRPSRREPESDSYSSSRDYREREREDRYSGRERRDERGWDRDRMSSRREVRRDDEDRPPRRERDPYEDRARGGRRDRDVMGVGGPGGGPGGRERKKSASPPPKPKEPTPDLTDTISILERKRRLTQWDIKPPGYENVTAEQAKLSGMFPLPGAPRQQPMDPSRLQAFISQPSGGAGNAALKPSNARQSKRLFVHNLPPSATEESIIQFFNLQLNGLNVIEGSDPCISAQLSNDQQFALLEFKTPSETTVALALDGITMEDSDAANSNGSLNGNSHGLSIRRPKDYIVPAVTDEIPYEEGIVSNIVPDTQNKISVSNVPLYLTDEQVTELLVSFGELKAFVLVKDRGTDESRGIAFCEYLDPAATDIAVEGLNGMELGDKHLKVGKASIGMQQASGLEMGVNAMSMLAGTTSQDIEEGRVLQLLNMVTPEELVDNDDYEEIVEDVKEECEKYGHVLEIKVPRPTLGSRQSNGVGKIFVKFDTSDSAGKALRSLAGRKFADRTVVTTFFSEDNFETVPAQVGMEPSSSSKVTVEYYDPSNVFPLISSGLLSRLPLRHLHWKSPSRPLRSIASLHVDLVPLGQSQIQGPQAPGDGLHRIKSSDSARSNDGQSSRPQSRGQQVVEQKTRPDSGAGTLRGPLKERRHQIPGLRQTPYLKLYLLRCDDNDTYKTSARKLLREWIKEHTPPSQSSASLNNQEQHDAFEWLIVHVVLPNTPAAAQPRASGSAGAGQSGGSERPASSSRWPGRGNSTLLEKIRSDFNASSKSATDRVTQLRLHKTDIPPHLVPESLPGSAATPYLENQQEHEAAWFDVISKFKSLILTSFDLRVSQYEEDIRERDSQRSLPGWNFCTFFVLKEGLARGFESVGLVEDALVGYDELSFGLDSIVREQAIEGTTGGQATTFLKYTEDLRRQAEEARVSFRNRSSIISSGSEGGHDSEQVNSLPLSESNKRYRDLILANNVSIFDFRCYVFARQMSLLLRLANAWSSRAELMATLKADPAPLHDEDSRGSASRKRMSRPSSSSDDTEDLLMLAEVCRRGVEFTTSVARVLKADLTNAYAYKEARENGDRQPEDDTTEHRGDAAGLDQENRLLIDNLVASWIFSVCQQILAETSTRSLPIPPSSIAESNPSSAKLAPHGPRGHEPKTAIPEPKTMAHPARSSSISMSNQGSRNDVTAPGRHPQRPTSNHESKPKSFLKPGIEELAFHRAEISILQRSALTRLGLSHGWKTTLEDIDAELLDRNSVLEDVDLEDKEDSTSRPNDRSDQIVKPIHIGAIGVSNKFLRAAVQSEKDFYNLFEILTDKALRHFTVASKAKSVQVVMSDLAALKFRQGDFATAATFFGRLAPFYADCGWSSTETTMLKIYASCLKKLGKIQDYVQALLELLAKAVAESPRLPRSEISGAIGQPKQLTSSLTASLRDPTAIETIRTELVNYAKGLPYEVTVPLERFFVGTQVVPQVRHYPDRDGFQLQLRLLNVLFDGLVVESVKVWLAGAEDTPSQEIMLEAPSGFAMEVGHVKVLVGSNIMSPGSYHVSKISIEAQNINFVYALASASSNFTVGGTLMPQTRGTTLQNSEIACYPRPESLEVKMELSRFVHLSRSRCIEITVRSGWNEIANGELRVKSGSAGLRLRTADTEIIDGDLSSLNSTKTGVLQFERLGRHQKAVFRLPYELERELPEILMKIDVLYETEKGYFQLSNSINASVVLPVKVNVQEHFKSEALYSKFAIATVSDVPIHILNSKLQGSAGYSVEASGADAMPMIIFAKQPASLLYKIKRVDDFPKGAESNASKRPLLELFVEYRCTDAEIRRSVQKVFAVAIEQSSFKRYYRWLRPFLLKRLSQLFTTADYETITLLNEIHIGSTADFRWAEALKVLPTQEAQPLQNWLESWQLANRVVHLDTPDRPEGVQQIVIPVEIPQIQVHHTVNLRIVDAEGAPVSSGSLVIVGQMLLAEVLIRSTRIWDTTMEQRQDALGPDGPPSENGEGGLEFAYEVHASADVWMIGGRKRARFLSKVGPATHLLMSNGLADKSQGGETQRFPIMLVPLRTGRVLVPVVDIKPYPQYDKSLGASTNDHITQTPHPAALPASFSQAESRSRRHDRATSTARTHIACETDYINQAHTVRIISDVRSTTTSLDTGATEGPFITVNGGEQR